MHEEKTEKKKGPTGGDIRHKEKRDQRKDNFLQGEHEPVCDLLRKVGGKNTKSFRRGGNRRIDAHYLWHQRDKRGKGKKKEGEENGLTGIAKGGAGERTFYILKKVKAPKTSQG